MNLFNLRNMAFQLNIISVTLLKQMFKVPEFLFLVLTLWSGKQHAAANTIMGYEYVQEADVWLRLHTVPAVWADARLRCQFEGGVLASPTTVALTKEMLAMMAKNHLTMARVFTGIHALVAKGHFMTIDGIPFSNTSLRWADGEPNNEGNGEDCVALTGVGEAVDVPCERVYPFICRKNSKEMSVNKCRTTDSEYQFESRTGSCYKFHQVARTWHQAAGACFAEGGHLAVVNSPAESQVLKELFAKHPDNTIRAKYSHVAMIGFWDWDEHTRNNEWRTIFGETLSEAGFAVWSPNEPNNAFGIEYCGSIVRDGLLNDFECNLPAVFICEITIQ